MAWLFLRPSRGGGDDHDYGNDEDDGVDEIDGGEDENDDGDIEIPIGFLGLRPS